MTVFKVSWFPVASKMVVSARWTAQVVEVTSHSYSTSTLQLMYYSSYMAQNPSLGIAF